MKNEKNKSLKTRNGGLWTEARFRSFITSILRGGSRRWGPKYETLNKACIGQKINSKSGRLAKHYKCNKCKEEFVAKDVTVDHIKPVVGIEGFISWDIFIERLFCPAKNLQVLCIPCHKEKTKKETVKRKKSG